MQLIIWPSWFNQAQRLQYLEVSPGNNSSEYLFYSSAFDKHWVALCTTLYSVSSAWSGTIFLLSAKNTPIGLLRYLCRFLKMRKKAKWMPEDYSKILLWKVFSVNFGEQMNGFNFYSIEHGCKTHAHMQIRMLVLLRLILLSGIVS